MPRPAPRGSTLAACGAVMLTFCAYIFAFGDSVSESVGAVLHPPVGGGGQGDPMGWVAVASFAFWTALGLICGVVAILAAVIAANRIDDVISALREWFVGVPKPRPGTGCVAAGAALTLQLAGRGLDQVFDLVTPPGTSAGRTPAPVFVDAAYGSLAGLSEELIVLALPLTVIRLLAPRWLRGWRLALPVVVLAVARLLYHLYQGWDAVLLTHVLWAPGMVLVYLWCRRVWPLIVQHAAFNLGLIPLSQGWWDTPVWWTVSVSTAAALLGLGLWRRRTAAPTPDTRATL